MNTQENPSGQFITLEKAKQLTTTFRENKDKILTEKFIGVDLLPHSETFDKKVIETLISQPGCASFRIYFGMEDDLKVSLVLVGVDEKGEDLLNPIQLEVISADGKTEFLTSDPIAENGSKCPPTCTFNSPLNP